jgi:hypothetical protein
MPETYRRYDIAFKQKRARLKQDGAASELSVPESTYPMYSPRSAKTDRTVKLFLQKQEQEMFDLSRNYLNPAFTMAKLFITRMEERPEGGARYNYGPHVAQILKNLPRYDSPESRHLKGVFNRNQTRSA